MADPKTLANHKKYQQLAKAHSELSKLVEKIRGFKKILKDMDEAKEMIKEEKDAEMEHFLSNELHRLEKDKIALEEDLKEMLVVKDPNDEKSIIVEIRAGTGGDGHRR